MGWLNEVIRRILRSGRATACGRPARGVAAAGLALMLTPLPASQAGAAIPGAQVPTAFLRLGGGTLGVAMGEAVEGAIDLVGAGAWRLRIALSTHRFGDYEVPHYVASAIVRAARETGFPTDTLMAIAEKESSFNVNARPPRGSALGLMQFIEQTWLQVVARHGAEVGLAKEAELIRTARKDGRRGYLVEDDAERKRILELRRDPYLSAALAAHNLLAARRNIESELDIPLRDADLYLPHFLGTGGARQLFAGSATEPDALAKAMFPAAARYNPSLFRDIDSETLTVTAFYRRMRGIIAKRRWKYRQAMRRPGVIRAVQRREVSRPVRRIFREAENRPVPPSS